MIQKNDKIIFCTLLGKMGGAGLLEWRKPLLFQLVLEKFSTYALFYLSKVLL